MWLDPDAGLYYVRARTYEPETGRFATRDPAALRPVVPETTVPYALAQSNPYVMRDPSGRTTLQELSISGYVRAQIWIGRATSAIATGSGVVRAWITPDHHVIPKFLQGLVAQNLYRMPEPVHIAFHQLLNLTLRTNGFPAANAAPGVWTTFFQMNPGAQLRAFQILLNVSRIIEGQFGAELEHLNGGLPLTSAVWREIYRVAYTFFH